MFCGRELDAAQTTERRKPATFLFCDLVGSTAMGEQIDLEVVRELTFTYFERARSIIERHGGHVEKFAGDAILGTFGIVSTREDDALGAVRAGIEVLDRLDELNREFDDRYGRRIELRVGVNTGEVIVGDITFAEPLVAGDAANIAARLQTLAEPGQLVVGHSTYQMVRDFVDARPLGPVDIRGKAEALRAYVIESVDSRSSSQRSASEGPLVGRASEVKRLINAYRACRDGHDRHLAIVTGEPGLGKSRLASELSITLRAETLDGNTPLILFSHCLPHGDGSTYGALIDLVSRLAANDIVSATTLANGVALVVDDDEVEAVAQILATAAGYRSGSATPVEIAWAASRVLRSLARDRVLVLVLDDLHWAQPPLIRVLDLLVERLSGAPILVLGLSRSADNMASMDALDDEARITRFELQPLTAAETQRFAEQTAGGAIDPAVTERVNEATGGNPLFVQELVTMLIEDEVMVRRDGTWEATALPERLPVPAGIEALLHGRLDALPDPVRAGLERVAVAGQSFSVETFELLAADVPGLPTTTNAVQQLVDRELLVVGDPKRRELRFRHAVIQDVAYSRNPKRLRADLHERFAHWLEATEAGSQAETQELVGTHLERAFGYRRELGRPGEAEQQLAYRAADCLKAAGSDILARSDLDGAIDLLRRSADLLDYPRRTTTDCLLAAVMGEAGRIREADEILDNLQEQAEVGGDLHATTLGGIERLIIQMQTDPGEASAIATQQLHHLLNQADHLEDPSALNRVWHLQALVHWHEVQCEIAARSWERAAVHARNAGDSRRLADALSWQASAALYGPKPVSESEVLCRRIVEHLDELGQDRLARSQVQLSLACLLAMKGDHHGAAELVATSDEVNASIGPHLHGAAPHREAFVATLRDDHDDAERRLRIGIEKLRSIGDHGLLSTNAAMLAHVVLAQGDVSGAMTLSETSEREAAPDDVITQVVWRTARAKALAQRGDGDDAEPYARAAIAAAERTDCLLYHGDALLDAARTYALLDNRSAEATRFLTQAEAVYQRKEHLIGVQRCADWTAEGIATTT